MELEGRSGREGVREWCARLNMWPTVTGARLNMQPFYLPAENTHPTSPTHTAFINEWLIFGVSQEMLRLRYRQENVQFKTLNHGTERCTHAWTDLKICSPCQQEGRVRDREPVRQRYNERRRRRREVYLYLAHCGSGSDETRTKHSGAS